MAKFVLSLPFSPQLNPKTQIINPNNKPIIPNSTSRRKLSLSLCGIFSLTTLFHSQFPLISSAANVASSNNSTSKSKSFLSGIVSTKSWFRFFGDGFAIRVPPEFQDIMEPEDYNAGSNLYGDKVKTKTFAAQFASTDGYEVLSVMVRASNSLKITFLEANDVSDLGSLKEAAKIFVPGPGCGRWVNFALCPDSKN